MVDGQLSVWSVTKVSLHRDLYTDRWHMFIKSSFLFKHWEANIVFSLYLWKMYSGIDPACSYSRQNSKTLPYKKWIRWLIFTYRFSTWYSRTWTLGQGKPVYVVRQKMIVNDSEGKGIGHFEFTGQHNCQFKESSRKRSLKHRQDWFLSVCVLTEDWAIWVW